MKMASKKSRFGLAGVVVAAVAVGVTVFAGPAPAGSVVTVYKSPT